MVFYLLKMTVGHFFLFFFTKNNHIKNKKGYIMEIEKKSNIEYKIQFLNEEKDFSFTEQILKIFFNDKSKIYYVDNIEKDNEIFIILNQCIKKDNFKMYINIEGIKYLLDINFKDNFIKVFNEKEENIKKFIAFLEKIK